MKFKHVVASLSLAMFTAFGVAAGLSMKKEAKSVAAEGEKWMVTICFDNTVPETSEEWGYIENQKVNFWGTNVTYAESVQVLHQSGRDNFYTVNVVFTSSQTVSGMQINFTEDGVKKESQDITIALDSTCNGLVYTYAFPETVSWDDGKWSYRTVSTAQTPSAEFGSTQKSFIADPETASYYIKDVELTNSMYVSLCPYSYPAHNWDDTSAAFRTSAAYFAAYFQAWYGPHWVEVKIDGTYDFFLTNEYVDGGTLDVKKHEGPTSASIYYVTNSASATGDYIYSWGGSEQFGAFPGTPITSVVGVQELTGNGVIHFQGGETAKLIYEIPVEIGYPTGDTMFMFNNGTAEYKSDERALVDEAAYWWTGPANNEAGDAIEFLVYAEARRNAVEDYSVCNISEANATAIINLYNSFDPEVAATYIDCTTVNTWADASKESETLVSYKSVVEQLGRMYNIPVNGSSLYFGGLDMAANGNVALIVIAVTATSALALTLLLVFKKRKHQ